MTIRAIDLQRLINLYGEPLTLVSKAYGGYNPATGQDTFTETEIALVGYQATFDIREVDGTNVLRGDRKIIFGNVDSAGNPIDPQIDDEVIGTGDHVSIVAVSKIMVGSTPTCYICQVRE